MRTQVFWIDDVPKGRLGIAPRPRGGEWLDGEIEGWSASGVHSVVSLLTSQEQNELDLRNEEAACRRHGLQFRALAIPDRGVPPSRAAFRRFISALLRDLNSGKTVVVHCRQGIGRSAVVVAAALTSAGEDPDRAFQKIERARGRPVPDTDEQRDWVRSFAESERRSAQRTRPSHRRTGTLKAPA